MAFGGGSFTTNCLDDIPFKLGPKFIPPTKVVLPPDFQHSLQPKTLNIEYTFEVEEAVLKWSAEKERQRLESEAVRLHQTVPSQDDNITNSSEDEEQPIYENANNLQEPLYENPGILIPQTAPRPAVRRKQTDDYVNTMLPNPLIANISNDILLPTQSNSSDENEEKNNGVSKKTNNIDLKWFENEEDPFDNLELQTINVMDELASVLEETKKSSPVPPSIVENGNVGPSETKNESDVSRNMFNDEGSAPRDNDEARSDSPEYENVDLKLVDLKINGVNAVKERGNNGVSDLADLPPIPPRRDLVGNNQPLPPIGHSTSEPSFTGGKDINLVNTSSSIDSINDQIGPSQASFQSQEGSKVISNRRAALPKPPRTFTYSRHEFDDGAELNEGTDTNCVNTSEPCYDNASQITVGNDLNVQFTNTDRSASETTVKNIGEELNFVQHHFGKENGCSTDTDANKPRPAPRRPPAPPPRPSSQQSWNRYSPLPPTGSGSVTDQSSSESESPRDGGGVHVALSPRDSGVHVASPRDSGVHVALYKQLSLEAQSSVDRLVTMGFSKDRVVRAVDKLGRDEKEVVEYLCLVDQLTEKGYSICLAETALLMFKNSMNQACAYLELFTQMQELGFNGEKIKEALVNTNNDREKTLDILTASS